MVPTKAMRGRLLARLASACLVAATLAATPTAGRTSDDGAAEAAVAVDANAFRPFEVHVVEGGTVTWDVREGGHTIVADDQRFSFTGDDGTLEPGTTPSHRFGAQAEVVRYHCSVHGGPGGQGMAGVVVVGDPRPATVPVPVLRVPQDVPTLAEAVAVVPAGGRIELAPGTHPVSDVIRLDRPDVTVAGTGERPDDVRVLAPAGSRGTPTAILSIEADRVAVADLSLAGLAQSALRATSVAAPAVRRVQVHGDGLLHDGIVLEDVRGGVVEAVEVAGARRAGVLIRRCVPCGVQVTASDLHDNLVGLLVRGAVSVVASGNHLHGNAAGLVVGALDRADGDDLVTATVHPGSQSTVVATGNVVEGNVRRDDLPPPSQPDRWLATGAGIWLAGSAGSVVEDNELADNHFGIVLSRRSDDDEVRANRLAGNHLDLGWDGLGASTCFAANVGAASTEPPRIEDLYPCDRPTVGIAHPIVDAALLAAALA